MTVKKSKKIVLISNDKVGRIMAGPGIRYFELAKSLSKEFEILLLVPDSCDMRGEGFEIKPYNSRRASSSIAKMLPDCDTVISQSLRPPLIRFIKKHGIRYIADLYDPLTIEALEYTKYDNVRVQNNTFWFNYWSLILQIHSADHILCSSESQKSFYLGVLSDQGLVNPSSYTADPNFKSTISLLPFGLDKVSPKIDSDFSISEKFPQISANDKIIYWGGGIWDWFDPISVIKAIEIIGKKRDDIKLLFLYVKHPNPKIKEMTIVQKALDYCKGKDQLEKNVIFNFDWIPYTERFNYLLSSTVGISTHFDSLETRFSFRTRILDYLWAELPIITTQGDSMADLVEKNNLGKVVGYNKPEEIAEAIEFICDNKDFIHEVKQNINAIKKDFFWDSVTSNITALINEDKISNKILPINKYLKLSLSFYYAGLKKKLLK